jgi:hypothetical protein
MEPKPPPFIRLKLFLHFYPFFTIFLVALVAFFADEWVAACLGVVGELETPIITYFEFVATEATSKCFAVLNAAPRCLAV